MNFFDLCWRFLMLLYNLSLIAGILLAYYYIQSPWLIFVIVLAVLTHPYFSEKKTDAKPPEEQNL